MMERKEQLHAWIETTRRLQRKMAVVFAALGIVGIGLLFWSQTAGTFALVCIALVALCSFWVTAAHNAAHWQKLEELRRIERNHGKPLQTAHRRWHAQSPAE